MPHSNHLTYEFGPYKLSLTQRVLTRDGEIISLTPKATEILVRLVVNAGQLLEKDDLLREVWPDTFVEEANLTQNIFTLRRALGDERAGPRYIETVSRRGYRFVADVRVCAGDAPAASASETKAPPGPDNDDVVSPRPVVAVLPFFNETGDERLEYLAEGLTDNIINNLSRVSRMRVMSRSAVFRRTARAFDAQNFGRELGATVVLVGKVTTRPATLGSVEPASEAASAMMGAVSSMGVDSAMGVDSVIGPESARGPESAAGVRSTLAAFQESFDADDPSATVQDPLDPAGKGMNQLQASGAASSGTGTGVKSAPASGADSPGTGTGVKAATASGVEALDTDVEVESARYVAASGGRVQSGTFRTVKTVVGISVELVEVATGWQIWGESFDCESRDLLQIQDAITRQLLVNLKLKLTGDEERRVTVRYTENAQAYQAYLEGRYHWSRYTRKGIETAIKNFRRAIEIDSNYALAYAAIVDCYLRLATNYLPPPDASLALKYHHIALPKEVQSGNIPATDSKIKLRFEWDLKGAERELRRASELKINYPAAHQWYAAYKFAQILFASSNESKRKAKRTNNSYLLSAAVPDQLARLQLTPNEHVQIFCAIAREQIDVGNYDAASEVLKSRWLYGEWPNLDGLTQQSCADLLFTAGELAGCVASARQLRRGQKHGEALLNGSIAIFEQLCSKRRAAEGRIELALCYYRQGMFDFGRSTLVKVLQGLSPADIDLRSLALIRLACLERHAGRLNDALLYLNEAESLVGVEGPWASGRRYLELASTCKDLATPGAITACFENAREYYHRALHEFEAVGNHRLCAIVENNLGVLLLIVGHYVDAEIHLLQARRAFDHIEDLIRRAQVDDSLARLYLGQRKLDEALVAIDLSVQTMELGDEDALLAESLTTKGLVYCELKRYNEAQKALDGAYRLASRCGDTEGAGKAVLVLVEKLSEFLAPQERFRIRSVLVELFSSSQHEAIKSRVAQCLKTIDS